MAPITDNDIQWYNELDIVAETGLPGPLVADLLPCLPTPPGAYSNCAQVYDSDSIQRALLVVQMLRVGIRLSFIRIAMAQPMTAEQVAESVAKWTALANHRKANHRKPAAAPAMPSLAQHRMLVILAATLAAVSVLLLGVDAGLFISR